MRSLTALALGALVVAGLPGCGQKGPLTRPTHSTTTPVVIRTAPAADTPTQPDADAPKH